MNKYIGYCLVFAGLCLIFSAIVCIIDWLACLSGSGGVACRPVRTEAVAAMTGAANVALGVALQDRNGL